MDSGQSVSESFHLKNFSQEAIVLLAPEEPASHEFSRTTDCAALLLLDPAEMSTCELILTFDPDLNGRYCDTLLIQSDAVNGQGGYVRIPLSGEQIASASPTQDIVPLEFALCQNYPNPFNPSTQITYALPKTGQVSLKVFNLLGEEVITLADEMQSIGTHTAFFDGSGLPSGIYLCRLQAGEFSTTRKMVLLK